MSAGRPIKQRTSKSYARDIESLIRLRTSLIVHEGAIGEPAVHAIDLLVSNLMKLLSDTKAA